MVGIVRNCTARRSRRSFQANCSDKTCIWVAETINLYTVSPPSSGVIRGRPICRHPTANEKCHLNLKISNGEIITISQMHVDKGVAMNGIEWAKKKGPVSEVDDQEG